MNLKTVAGTFVALLCSLTCAAQSPSPTPEPVGPTKPVIVVNTPANPVPVTGTISGSVSVTNTLNVNATQSGTWTVGIDGTPTVKIDPDANTVIAKTGSPRLHYSSGSVKPANFGTFIFPGGEKIRVYGINRCESTQEFKLGTVLIDSGIAGNVFLPLKTVSVGAGDHFTEVFELLGGSIQLSNSGGSCDNGNVRWFVYTN